ncbi:hypothetical protein L208DRAFT_1406867 [Tricholoma matsutake]|nr:hypothetical protein L208DRAFT_1406867 [Tricholoma matsutake 945]
MSDVESGFNVQRSGSAIFASSGWEAMQNVSHFSQAVFYTTCTLTHLCNLQITIS